MIEVTRVEEFTVTLKGEQHKFTRAEAEEAYEAFKKALGKTDQIILPAPSYPVKRPSLVPPPTRPRDWPNQRPFDYPFGDDGTWRGPLDDNIYVRD